MRFLPNPADRPAPSMSAPERVLIFRIGHFGDSIVALPALWAIRAAYPNAQITLLGAHDPAGRRPSIAEVLPSDGLVDEIVTYPANATGLGVSRTLIKLVWRLRSRRFDMAVYLAPSVRTQRQLRRDRWLLRALNVGSIIGATPSKVAAGSFVSISDDERETTFLLSRLASAGLSPPAGQERMDLALTIAEKAEARAWRSSVGLDDGQRLVALAPTAGMPSKVWPLDRFALVGRTLFEQWGLTPVIVTTQEDGALVQRLTDTIGAGVGTLGQLKVRPLGALLADCQLFVGNDSGPAHLAAAVRTPVVAVFSGYESSKQWWPHGEGHIVLRHHVECAGCRAFTCPVESQCLTGISAERVIDACRSVLERQLKAAERERAPNGGLDP